MKKINIFYSIGFSCWSILLLMRIYGLTGNEFISESCAKIELFLHLFMLPISYHLYKKCKASERVIFFWFLLINLSLFINDAFFYYVIYFSNHHSFNILINNFLLIFIPYSSWIISAIIFLIYIINYILSARNFIKLFSTLVLMNIGIVFLFIYSTQPTYDYLSWQNLSQVISSIAELIIYNLGIFCLIHSESKGLSFITIGLIVLISGDFIIGYSFLARTNSIATYGELFWLLGVLFISYGIFELKSKTPHPDVWLRSTYRIKSKLAFWAFGISTINVLPFFILAFLFSPLNKTVFIILPSFLMLTSVMIVILSLFIAKNFEVPFKKITNNIELLMIEDDKKKINSNFNIEEFIFLQNFILQVFEIKEEREAARKALITLAAQVAHDIRSPLSALNICLDNLPRLPDKQRTLMHNVSSRINDIANNLLSKYNDNENIEQVNDRVQLKTWLISPVVDNIMSEKRIQFEEQSIKLESIITHEGFLSFGNFDTNIMKRLLSNLLNNSAESLSYKPGKIIVTLDANSENIFLNISDNGCGIKPELLSKVFKKGISFKKNGYGLGLFDAKRNIESYGGTIELSSIIEEGTTVAITLPRLPHPNWFASKIFISPNIPISILDDDESVHNAWEQRLEAISGSLAINHFYDTAEFSKWYAKQSAPIQVFSDYELLGSPETGLCILKKLNSLSNNSILVTSHYEKPDIIEECQKIGVRILPKNLLEHISIEISYLKNLDLILIDDSRALCQSWEIAAQISGKKILTFNSINEFQLLLPSLEYTTSIYIDSNLDNEIKGETYAKELFSVGFSNIYLVTGYPPSHFDNLPWIKEIVGKQPPF